MRLEECWDQLDSRTQEWLLSNRGCILLPRTVSSVINRSVGGQAEEDQHGQIALTQEDLRFIGSRARSRVTS